MTLTIDDVGNWHPEQLGEAGKHARKVSEGLDGVIGTGVTDTKVLEDTKAWSGAAGQAANTRMDTEKSRASAVSAELLALGTAFDEQVQNLQNAKDKVLRLRDDAINQQPPFEVSPDGTVGAAARIAEIRRAEGNGKGGAETAIVAEGLEAARRQWELANALHEAEAAATTARTKVSAVVAKLQTAFDGLGEPNLGLPAAPNTSNTPAAVTTPAPDTTNKPRNVMSNHNGSGSGSPASPSYTGSPMSGAPTGPMPTGDQKRWIEEAIKTLRDKGYHISDSDAAIIAAMIEKESGGNPHAINLWDSNAAAGIPSKGLMQTIDPTFNAYKLPGHDDIWNPVDNIIAGSRYAIERYGSLSNVPGIAAMSRGEGYVGY